MGDVVSLGAIAQVAEQVYVGPQLAVTDLSIAMGRFSEAQLVFEERLAGQTDEDAKLLMVQASKLLFEALYSAAGHAADLLC